MKRSIAAFVLGIAVTVAFAGALSRTPILRGYLQSDLDGNGFSVTNVNTYHGTSNFVNAPSLAAANTAWGLYDGLKFIGLSTNDVSAEFVFESVDTIPSTRQSYINFLADSTVANANHCALDLFSDASGSSRRLFFRVGTSEISLTPTGLPLTLFNSLHSLDGTPDANNDYYGQRITGLNGGEVIAQWDAVRVHSDGELHLADADAAAEYPAIGLAVTSGTDGNPLTFATSGPIRNDAWNWTPGGTIWLSTTPGGLTQTQPSTTGDAIQAMGVALSADVMLLRISPDYGIAP